MAVRSGLMEDVNRGPRVEENVEIHMKDKQPKATEADGKEKKQSFESRKLEVIVDVNEDGEIISTSTANQEFVALPGVVYEYWSTLTVRGDPGCHEVRLDNLNAKLEPINTALGDYGRDQLGVPIIYPSAMISSDYESVHALEPERMSFGIQGEDDRVRFGLWDIKCLTGYTLTLTGDACGYKNLQKSSSIKLRYIAPELLETPAGEVKCFLGEPPQQVSFMSLGMPIGEDDGHRILYSTTVNTFPYPITYSFLQLFTIPDNSEGIFGNGFNGRSGSSYVTGRYTDNDYVVDLNPEDHTVLDTHVTLGVGQELSCTTPQDCIKFYDAPSTPLSVVGKGDSCEKNNIDLIQYARYTLYFKNYLMMRVGEPGVEEGTWEPEGGTYWVPINMVSWNLVSSAECSLDEQQCRDCIDWLTDGYVSENEEVPHYDLPYWVESSIDVNGPYVIIPYGVPGAGQTMVCFP